MDAHLSNAMHIQFWGAGCTRLQDEGLPVEPAYIWMGVYNGARNDGKVTGHWSIVLPYINFVMIVYAR